MPATVHVLRRLERDDSARLLEVVRELSYRHDVDGVREVVREAARELIGADGVTFVLREGDQVFYAEEDAIAPLWKGRRFPIQACISGWAILNRQPAVIEDVYADDRIPHDVYRPTFVKSLAMVPVREDEPLGAIGAYWAARRMPTEREVSLVQALAGTVAVALENAALYRRLQDAVQVRDEFLVLAAHELKTPLTALELRLRNLDRSLERGAAGAEARDGVARVGEQARRLGRLVSRLLDVSRLSGEGLGLEREPLDLAALAREVAARLSSSRGSAPVQVGGDASVRGRWDGPRLEQLLESLVDNALRFGAGQPVEVEVTRTDEGARVSVRDHGIGIAPADLGRVFERFERAASTRSYGGFGLGLWLAREIARAHGGDVAVESTPGAGSLFTAVLPG